MTDCRGMALLGTDGQRLSWTEEARLYEAHLGASGRQLARYLRGEEHAIGDMLAACGLSTRDAAGRSAVKRLLADAGVPAVRTGGRRRQFTGYDVILVALLHELRRLALPLGYVHDAYKSLAMQARSDLRIDAATLAACLEGDGRRRDWFVAELLRIRYPIAFVWQQADARLSGSLGVTMQGLSSFWSVGSSGARVGDPSCPAVVIRVSPIVAKIAARVPALPAIPPAFCEPATLKKMEVTAPERALLEAIKHAHRAARFHVETDGAGSIVAIRYSEMHISGRTGAKALLEDPTTHAVRSVRGSDGRAAHYEREVLLKF